MILLIDNYDSFTWNLVHLIGGIGFSVDVRRNDEVSAAEAIGLAPRAIILSPGPCTPSEAGVCLPLVAAAIDAGVPLFGVCLGLQAIAQACGGRIVRAGAPVHGKTSDIVHQNDPLFSGLPSPFRATRYHSLVADRSSLPNSLTMIAEAADDGEIMALTHAAAPVAGVQFHPESIATEHGAAMLSNFFDWSGVGRP